MNENEKMKLLHARQMLRERMACGMAISPSTYGISGEPEGEDSNLFDMVTDSGGDVTISPEDFVRIQAEVRQREAEPVEWELRRKLDEFMQPIVEQVRKVLFDASARDRHDVGTLRELKLLDFLAECPNPSCKKNNEMKSFDDIPCNYCGEPIKESQSIVLMKGEFTRTALKATQAIITQSMDHRRRITDADDHAGFSATLDDGEVQVLISEGDRGKKNVIIECLNASAMTEQKLKTEGGEDITFHLQKKGRYYSLAKRAQGQLKKFIMTLRSADDIPTESGLDDAAKKRMQGSRHSEWAEKHAIQILGCIHHHYRYLAELETTSTNDGSTTLLVLSSDLTSDIEETFTNDKGQNELELLVRESAIQPMIHPPLDWNKVEVDGKTQAQAKVSMQEAPLPNEPGFDEWEKAESEAAAKRKKDAARHPQAGGTEKAAEEEDWSETRFSGGYLSTLMRSRREIISGERRHVRQGEWRFKPSEQALERLNDLQSVAWTVEHELIGVFREIIELDTESRLTGGGSGGALSLTISDDGKTCIVKAGKNLEAQCPVGDGSNTLEWIRELDQAEWMCNDVDIDGRFHHVWHFDYRGRMYTASPRLSPIGDDLSRGLLRFAESQPLNSRGWYWLQVYTAGLWEGRENGSTGVPIPGAPTEKTFEAFYEAAQNPEFIEELRKVVRSPVNTFDIWGEGDSLRSKAEGFLRLNATIAFIEALDEGGKGALCNLPVVQDASSNVYQHMSAIIRDADMAKEVNVLPNEAGGRADVYMKVAEVAKEWLVNDDFKLPDKVKMPSGKQRKLSEEEKGGILEVIKRYVMDEKEGSRTSSKHAVMIWVALRSSAKYPVMTVGYGAGVESMKEGLLSHNGDSVKDGGHLGKHVIEEKGMRYEIECAHPISILKQKGRLDDVGEELHLLTARQIMVLYKRAIDEVLPGHYLLKNALRFLQESLTVVRRSEGDSGWHIHESKKKKRRTWRKKGANTPEGSALKWSLIEGSHVRLAILYPDFQETQDVHLAVEADLKERFDELQVEYRPILRNVLEEDEIEHFLAGDPKRRLDWIVINERFGFKRKVGDIKTSKHRVPPRGNQWDAIRKAVEKERSDADVAKQFVDALQKLYRELKKVRLSWKRESTTRDTFSERDAISPNFVHSFDATHLRLVIQDLVERLEEDGEPIQLWAVHDAIGTHANHIDDMRVSVVRQFAQIHDADTGAHSLIEQNRIRVRTEMLETLGRLMRDSFNFPLQEEEVEGDVAKCFGCLRRFDAETVDDCWELFTPKALEMAQEYGVESDPFWVLNDGRGEQGKHWPADVKAYLRDKGIKEPADNDSDSDSDSEPPKAGYCQQCAMNEQLLEVATRFNKLHTDDDDDADLKSALDRIEHAMGVGLPTEEEEQPEVRRRLIDNLGSALGFNRERVDEFYVKCVEEIRWWRAALSEMVEEVDLALFEVLEVAPDAPGEDIRHAYRKLARRHHPDRNPGDDDAEERFKAIEAAYEKVKAIRADYDQKRQEGVDPRFVKKYPVMTVEEREAQQKKKVRKQKKGEGKQPMKGNIEKKFWGLLYEIVAIMENGSSSLITSGTMDMALVAELDEDGRPLSEYLVG